MDIKDRLRHRPYVLGDRYREITGELQSEAADYIEGLEMEIKRQRKDYRELMSRLLQTEIERDRLREAAPVTHA
jgi:hypothetical protein